MRNWAFVFFAWMLFGWLAASGLPLFLQVGFAYWTGIICAKRLGDGARFAIFVVGLGAVAIAIDVLNETYSRSGPGWGKADLVIYQYKPLTALVVPSLLAVMAAAFWLTLAWKRLKPRDRSEEI